jgi:hypothetical protein
MFRTIEKPDSPILSSAFNILKYLSSLVDQLTFLLVYQMADPIAEYFAQYPDFPYNPQASADFRQIDNFNRLAMAEGWSQARRNIEFDVLKRTWTTLVEEEYAGTSLDHYQCLCEDLDVDSIPETVNKCKDMLRTKFVNIIDLTTYRRDVAMGLDAAKPQTFGSLNELKEYSKAQKKWYPVETAKAEMLRELLRVLH